MATPKSKSAEPKKRARTVTRAKKVSVDVAPALSVQKSPRRKPAQSRVHVNTTPLVAPITPPTALAQATPTSMIAFTPKPAITMLGVAALTLGMSVGIWNMAQKVGSEVSYSAPTHREGRVAGATVTRNAGVVTITVDTGTSTKSYAVGINEPLSVYNILRVANETTLLTTSVQLTTNSSELMSVDGVQAPGGQRWQISVDGSAVESLDAIAVSPGSTIALMLPH